MTSTLLIIYRILLIGIILSFAWAFVAYIAAFRATRREAYRVRAIVWLIFAITATANLIIFAPAHGGSILPPLLLAAFYHLRVCFSDTQVHEVPEYRSPLAIMLFKAPLATPQQDGLFVPSAQMQRPSPAAILTMTVGLLGAIWVLMGMIALIG
jgi:hypothetical protein